MTEIAFYHLTRSPLEAALPKLLEKTLAAGKRAVVMAGSGERVEHLNAALWTYDPASWLPHGSVKDGHAGEHPVWLTDVEENPGGAQFLFLTDGAECRGVDGYERCFELFDGHDPDRVQAARARWKAYKDAGHDLTYWQQTETGGWSKKDT
ncbi:MAG: DNA polymerase III subunit chi [Alphaproteobacteria bacterium]|nr:DNA polymerase III subunit chi [Alphaproteobacteria bacterium]